MVFDLYIGHFVSFSAAYANPNPGVGSKNPKPQVEKRGLGVESLMLTLNTCDLYYILIRHCVSFALPPSIFFPNLVSTMLLPHGFRHAGPSLWNPPSLIISDQLTLTLSSNPILKLTFSMVQASLPPNNFYPRTSDST